MKKNILLWAFAFVSLLAGAIPPDPAYMQQLLEQGDTARYMAMRSAHAQQAQLAQSAHAAKKAAAVVGEPYQEPRGLVILVEFQDKEFATPRDTIDSMLNAKNYTRNYNYRYGGVRMNIKSSGSARQYFIDQSMGQYTPQFDVVGPYKVANNYAYYGEDGTYNTDLHAYEMIVEAAQLAYQDSVDFSLYDANGDDMIDFVYVIYAGYGQADGGGDNTVWPHTYYIYSGYGIEVNLGGKYLDTYACGNEIGYTTKAYCGIGTFVHEFSHILGLPDLYATNYATHKTMGSWDIMDAGPYNNDKNTPPAYSAYERYFMGWLQPTSLSESSTVTLTDLKTSNKAFIVTRDGEFDGVGYDPNPKEFYMIEYRRYSGWDAGFPWGTGGMLVTHINYSASTWAGNTVNNNAKKMGVDLVEADSLAPDNSSGKKNDAFPYGSTECILQFGNALNRLRIPIANIKQNSWDNTVTFDFMPEVTPVEEVHEAMAPMKVLRNGQVLIRKENSYYDLLGREVL